MTSAVTGAHASARVDPSDDPRTPSTEPQTPTDHRARAGHQARPGDGTDDELQPVRLRVVGGGEVAVALAQLSSVLRWDCVICERLDEADDLGGTDALVVLSNDLEVAGAALCRGLAGGLDYVGGLGGATTQRLRRDWLRSRRVDPQRIDRVHGPAGLDIGADGPAEIALSIIAEITAVRHGAVGGPLSPVS